MARETVQLATVRQLADELRVLLAAGASAAPESFVDLGRRLQANPSLCGVVSHEIWHFLADADIRARDPAYAASQAKTVEEAIGILERHAI
jgi:hypothetical protein